MKTRLFAFFAFFAFFALFATPAAAQLAPLPTHLDFGAAPSDCNLPRGLVSLTNPGGRPVEVTDVALDGADLLELRALPPLPFTLDPGAGALVTIATGPAAEGPWQGNLRITTSEGDAAIGLAGEVLNRVEDRYVRPPPPWRTDLLLVIDDGPSMRPHLRALADGLANYASYLEVQLTESRVAVTTMSYAQDGRFLALPASGRTVLEVEDPDFVSALVELGGVGAGGPANHAGLWAARRALSEDNLAGPNRGFLRPYATLKIIVISNAPDLSPGSLDDYAEDLRALYGFRRTDRMTLWAIVGDDCADRTAGLSFDTRYARVAWTTGGGIGSLCAPHWDRALDSHVWESFGPGFRLQHAPLISSLTVSDDLVSVPAMDPAGHVNWTYEDDVRKVDFSPFSYPGYRSEVTITYRPRCELARPAGP